MQKKSKRRGLFQSPIYLCMLFINLVQSNPVQEYSLLLLMGILCPRSYIRYLSTSSATIIVMIKMYHSFQYLFFWCFASFFSFFQPAFASICSYGGMGELATGLYRRGPGSHTANRWNPKTYNPPF